MCDEFLGFAVSAHCGHGRKQGVDPRLWTIVTVKQEALSVSVTLRYVAPTGDQGLVRQRLFGIACGYADCNGPAARASNGATGCATINIHCGPRKSIASQAQVVPNSVHRRFHTGEIPRGIKEMEC